MVNSHLKKVLLVKQLFYKVYSNDSYDWLKFHIFAWLGLSPDYAPGTISGTSGEKFNGLAKVLCFKNSYHQSQFALQVENN